jgi:hypothetical protein
LSLPLADVAKLPFTGLEITKGLSTFVSKHLKVKRALGKIKMPF